MTSPSKAARGGIKVVVWDLDNTIWDGVLLEGDAVRLRPAVVPVLRALDGRGILCSIASKNDYDMAMERLQGLGIADYFIYPQIGWSAKSSAVETIAGSINVGLDAIAFIDDDPFERAEVSHALPQVMVLDAAEAAGLVDRPELMPRFITEESALRRRMYQADIERNRDEQSFQGPQEEFLAALGMKLAIAPAGEADLRRAEELTVRTNQLNSTGQTYSYEELDVLRRSAAHLLLIAGLEDRYGTYGKIGLALIAKQPRRWTLELLLMSCRVISRGVGTILIHHLLHLAKAAGVELQAVFKPTPRNRMMLVTYKFAGFREIGRQGDLLVFDHPLDNLQPFPPYVEVETGGCATAAVPAG
ncbi:MAG TPA: HAD-IIIC family phosphatase [Thermoanaerobaculia bacterium]|nr:HAD-IIIC family phosphatase [Thermoanaerobaculia bacterium]